MKTEYFPQMRLNTGWRPTRKPFGSAMFIVENKEVAEKFNQEAKEAWEKLPEKIAPPMDTRPIEYRVMKREVSDWTQA